MFVVRADGAAARWLDLDLAGPARRAGLLATAGAGFEGVAVLGDRIVVAAERDPRGLVVATAGGGGRRMDRTGVSLPAGRRLDFSDLTVDGGRLFGLVRNGDAVVELAPAGDGLRRGALVVVRARGGRSSVPGPALRPGGGAGHRRAPRVRHARQQRLAARGVRRRIGARCCSYSTNRLL